MPIYPYQCQDCGAVDDVFSSYEEIKSLGFPPCEVCGSSRTLRKYTPMADPDGESGFKSVTTDMLGDQTEEFRTRREWKNRMDELGVIPKERGMDYRAEVRRIERARREYVLRKEYEIRRMLHDRGVRQDTREADHAWSGKGRR